VTLRLLRILISIVVAILAVWLAFAIGSSPRIATINSDRQPVAASPNDIIPAKVPDRHPEPAAGLITTPKLIVPVAGIKRDQLRDTYNDARSEGRVHNALDIPAPKHSAVLAAADGEIKRLFYSERGGKTLYQLTNDQRIVLYYAHLDEYAAGITEGLSVRQGDVLAYVGDTGNAGPGNYHLHFAIWSITDPKHIWSGDSINPYPLMR